MVPRCLIAVAVSILSTTLASSQIFAAEPPVEPQRHAALVRVHLPLKGNADQNLQASLQRLRDHLLAAAKQSGMLGRPSLVLQLEPAVGAEGDGKGSQFERVLSLARFLCSHEMAGVRTVAYLPKSVRGHGALLAVACEEIVMAPDAEIGEAGIDEAAEGTIRKTVVAAYREIAEARRTLPVALAVGMVDASRQVLQIETEEGTHFILGSELEAFASEHEVIQETTLVPHGTFATFSGREGRQFGFVKYLAVDASGLAEALGVSVNALQEDDTLAADWQPMMVDVSGPITARSAGQLESVLGTELQRGTVNWIGVRIDSSGGDLAASIRMAMALARVDANSVRTVAYVPAEASGGAALVALSCDQLVMHPDAQLSAGPVGDEIPAAKRQALLDAATTSIRESLAPRTERSWSLLAATLNPRVEISQYRNKVTGEQRLMSAEEVADSPQAENWQWVAALNQPGQPLAIDGVEAEQLRLTGKTVDSFEGLKDEFGFEEDPPVVEPNWALELIEALASPEFATLLLAAGFAGVYFEVRTPGMGVGGFIAAVAFLLFFWSKYLHGTAGWLEALLFVAGVGFILLEIFVMPGFGVFGLGGGAMVVASLILASLTFIRPHSQSDLDELARSVGTVAIAGMALMAFAFAARRYLTQAPVLGRMVLAPPQPEDQAELDHRESLADYTQLIGAQGIAHTDLRPAGKAEVDHQLLDVIAESEPLDRGTPIVVVEAHGGRVVVRASS